MRSTLESAPPYKREVSIMKIIVDFMTSNGEKSKAFKDLASAKKWFNESHGVELIYIEMR